MIEVFHSIEYENIKVEVELKPLQSVCGITHSPVQSCLSCRSLAWLAGWLAGTQIPPFSSLAWL